MHNELTGLFVHAKYCLSFIPFKILHEATKPFVYPTNNFSHELSHIALLTSIVESAPIPILVEILSDFKTLNSPHMFPLSQFHTRTDPRILIESIRIALESFKYATD